jgi:hypothetical protein
MKRRLGREPVELDLKLPGLSVVNIPTASLNTSFGRISDVGTPYGEIRIARSASLISLRFFSRYSLQAGISIGVRPYTSSVRFALLGARNTLVRDELNRVGGLVRKHLLKHGIIFADI